ncbi:uncharacterized protein LOC135498401 [Lineus longissimus]|uniref:uncharacterized protein LOC135498401 n=1 Tax=Lineus longissimus TaxID=88925 RepID=UPI00315CE6B5
MGDKDVSKFIQKQERALRQDVSTWRKVAVDTEKLCVSCEDPNAFDEAFTYLLFDAFTTLEKAFRKLEELYDLQGKENESYVQKYQDIEELNYYLTKKLSDALATLKQKNMQSKDTVSVTNKKEEKQSVDTVKDYDENVNAKSNDSPDNPKDNSVLPKRNATACEPATSDVANLISHLVDQVNLSRLPPPEPGVFSGDPLSFPSWKAAYCNLIERKNISAPEKIHYLKRYLSKSVKEVVDGYLTVADEDSYNQAWMRLEKRYGDPFIIANAFRDKLDQWPDVPSRDGKALRKFSDFLRQCLAAMKVGTKGNLNILDDERENQKILRKLPDWLINRWNRTASTYKQTVCCHPPFHYFVTFIEQEAELACDPVTSVQAVKKKESRPGSEMSAQLGTKEKQSWRKKAPATRSFATETKERKCFYCEDSHLVQTCPQLSSKPLKERQDFVRSNALCWGCLHKGHRSKDCKTRLQCKVCSKNHPTLLHMERSEPAKTTRNLEKADEKSTKTTDRKDVETAFNRRSRTNVAVGCKSSMIVPVWLSHKDHPHSEIMTYAMLDTQSDTTFILESLRQELSVDGTITKLKLSTVSAQNNLIETVKVKNLLVRGLTSDSEERLSLPPSFTREVMPAKRSHIPTPAMAEKWPHLRPIAKELPAIQDCDVGILIGYDCPKALNPRKVISGVEPTDPFAQKTDLGWGIIGIIDNHSSSDDPIGVSHKVLTYSDIPSVEQKTIKRDLVISNVTIKEVLTTLEADFKDTEDTGSQESIEDRRFVHILTREMHQRPDGHYEAPLPFRNGKPKELPENRRYCLKRLNNLKTKLNRDPEYRRKYVDFMQKIIDRGDAELAPQPPLAGQHWYLPHFGVFHPKKPEKIRVVFDCRAEYMGHSLNQYLLPGPDLTNSLLGILCRFRKEKIAITCDVEQMFHQFKVNPDCRDYLRFLWWPDGDTDKEPVDHLMSVQLFGATSSPSVCNFGLKRIATDYEEKYGSEAANFVREDFYCDDGLKSVPAEDEAIDLVGLCSEGKLRLHKFASNSEKVLLTIDEENRAIKDSDLQLVPHVGQNKDQVLGMYWSISSDQFQFKITLKARPVTRRGILSTIGTIYDPLGLISPVLLVGRLILQELCSLNLDWDSPLPKELQDKWENWREELHSLEKLRIPRCIKPADFGEAKSVIIHHFSDASQFAYGQCSYARMINSQGQIHCSLIMGKARVAPLRPVTIPRLELTAAVLSAKVAATLRRELSLEIDEETLWTDSKVTLGYIQNEARRFHVFVSNRVQQIRDSSEPSQWKHVRGQDNPADEASRGMTVEKFITGSMWLKGPTFLWEPEIPAQASKEIPELSPDDPEVKTVTSLAVQAEKTAFETENLKAYSTWEKARRSIAIIIRYRDNLRRKAQGKAVMVGPLKVEDLRKAELEICKAVQQENFSKDIAVLRKLKVEKTEKDDQAKGRKLQIKGTSAIYRLGPFLDEDGVLRVGGRLRRADIPSNLRHPVVLPKSSYVTTLILRHCHEKVLHGGRGFTVSSVREEGYWMIGCRKAVGSFIGKCITCRRLRRPLQQQMMADLPKDRLESSPPFSFVGADAFGPFYVGVTIGRKTTVKRYGIVFTCLSMRAVHIETVTDMTTDAFINALRRLIAIRGPISLLRCDRGTNFVGARNELQNAWSEMDFDKVQQFLLKQECNLEFRMNVPYASHHGGVWERQIRTMHQIHTVYNSAEIWNTT